jgi:hypothetical protein
MKYLIDVEKLDELLTLIRDRKLLETRKLLNNLEEYDEEKIKRMFLSEMQSQKPEKTDNTDKPSKTDVLP